MEKDIATRMLRSALALEKEIGELHGLMIQLEDGAEKEELVRAWGDIIGVLTKEFVLRIVRLYLELDPDR